MAAVLLEILTWGLRVVAMPSFFVSSIIFMITDSSVSDPGTSEETFLYASYNCIFLFLIVERENCIPPSKA